MRKILLAFSFVLALTQIAISQHRTCATDIMYNKAKARNPFLEEARLNYEELIQQKMLELRQNRDGETEAVLVIPVVFHIIHLEGSENITDAQIWDQMEIVNRDYRKLNADTIQVVSGFDTIIADVKLEFRLATKDFLGNCTNGIERISSIETLVGDNGSKLSQWPRERYLNVWTVARIGLSGAAGYSQYPSAVIDAASAKADGVILLHDYIGSIGTGSEYRSRALTHEIGHYLNLAHTWGSTNDPEVECGDDGVADIPTTSGHDNCGTLYDFECNKQGLNNSASSPNLVSAYNFEDVTLTSGSIDPTDVPSGVYEADQFNRLQFGSMRASGVSANPVASGIFAYKGWGTGAPDGATDFTELTGSINTADYYEFSITPTPGTLMTLTNMSFKVKRNETGARTYAVRSSLNSYSTNIGVSSVASNPMLTTTPIGSSNATGYFINIDTNAVQLGSKFNLAPATGSNPFATLHDPVTFRIYGWNAEDAEGSFEIDSLSVNGIFGLNENIQNYMEYSYCSHMFTEGQKERMRSALSVAISGRSNLYTENNRFLTGTDDNPLTCAPNADFYPSNRFACIGDEITMIDNSTNGTVDSWLWTFEDGNPATSTSQFPEVSFNSYGRKTITLTVGNAQGSTSKTIEQSVIVAPQGTEFPGGLLQEGFDSYDEFYNHWIPGNFDHNMSFFRQVNTVGYSNNTSAMLNAYDMDMTNIDEGGMDIDELVSPVMDLSNIEGNAEVTFNWAFATQSIDLSGITDAMSVYISSNCGRTWSQQPRLTLEGLDLVTAGNVSVPFVPASSSEWSEENFTIPSAYLGPGFRMKFIYYASEFPNNLYLDNINLTGTISVPNLSADFYGASLFPNPAELSTTLSYHNNSSAKIEVTLTDMSGRIVERWNPNSNTPGIQTIQIGTDQLAKGVYMVNLKSEKNVSTLKLVVR